MVELMVVLAIIAMLTSMGFYMFDAAREREKVVETTNTIQRLSEAIEAYYAKTLQYPPELATESPNGLGETSGNGYLAHLRGKVGTTIRQGATVKSQSLFFYEPKPEFIFDADHVMDIWGWKIEYRVSPRNTQDLKNRFNSGSVDAKNDVLNFPGNPKKYNLWSPGKDGNSTGQKYQGTIAPATGSANSNYNSGGYQGTDYAEDDIGNW